MFNGSGSPPPDIAIDDSATRSSAEAARPANLGSSPTSANAGGSSPTSHRASMSDKGGGSDVDRRSRRSSGVSKARDMFSSAKNAFSGGSSSPSRSSSTKEQPSAIQRLGKTDPALSVPQGSLNNAAGESSPGPRSTFRVGVTEDKNKKCRRTMEDTHAYLYNFLSTPAPAMDTSAPSDASSGSSVLPETLPIVETDNGYFAIFDGHAGTFAAEWCGKKLHILLEETIRKNPNRPIPELLDETFTNVDQQLEKLPLKNSGCTAVIAVLRWEDRIPNSQSATGSTSIAPATAAAVARERSNSSAGQPPTAEVQVEARLRQAASRQRVLYTANVGDARIVLCRNGKALRLSYDHKGSDDNEGKRIANAGGLILNNRVNGVLAVTRALGDAYMKDLVTGHPYTTETVIQPDIDEFMILACDGLWDVCSDQEAVDLIRHTHDPLLASKQLVEHALARFSTDNLSCMVVRFDNKLLQDTVANRVEPIGVEGDPASQKGGVTEVEAIVGAVKKKMSTGGRDVDESELSRVSQDIIREQDESRQEPGPELRADVLERARQKAAAGKAASDAGSN